MVEVALIDKQGTHGIHRPNGCRVRPAIEQWQLGYRGGRSFDGKHHLASTGRGPEDFHAPLNDQKDTGARLSFPKEHFARSESSLYRPLREPLNFGFTESRK